MIASPAHIPSQVQNGRSAKRALAARKTREEEHVGEPEPRRRAARHDERDRELREDRGVVVGDRPGRAAPDRVGVDPGDHERDRDHRGRAPRTGREEQPAERRQRGELGEVRRARRARAAPNTSAAAIRQRRRSRAEAAAARAAASASQVSAKKAGIRTTATSDDVLPQREPVQVRCRLEPRRRARRRASVRRQRGPPGADWLERVPKACLRRLVVE